MFEHMDDDKSGALSAEELSKGLSSLGYQVRRAWGLCFTVSSCNLDALDACRLLTLDAQNASYSDRAELCAERCTTTQL